MCANSIAKRSPQYGGWVLGYRGDAMRSTAIALFFVLASAVAAEYPEASITNGVLKARLHLPDAKTGYYQATRFDWSGQMPSLEYKGHTFFGQWNPAPYTPKLHDA